ncbi:MAG: ABC transporter permease [Ilumatobacteraceae bacterium]
MSIKARRTDRRRRRAIDREVKLDKLRQGTNLRASPGWATVVQALAFVRKELAEIIRQPRLLALLVLGPFVLLLLFGAGYKDTTVELRTAFVGPDGSLYEQAVTDHVDDLDEYIDPQGFTSDRQAALRRLEDGELDAVVVFPTDALDQILGGESAKIEVLHEKLDPIQQAAIDIASRLAVQEVNASVLSALAGGAQRVVAPVDEAAAAMTQQAAALSAAAAAGDTTAMTDAAASVAGTLRDARLVMTATQDVVGRLGGDVGAAGDVLARIESAEVEATALGTGDVDGADLPERAETLASALEEAAEAIPQVTSVDPAVLVRPFQADTRNIAPVTIDPIDYFAPASIALLLQHLALTFAALSLVRDRELGLLELLRVGPLSSSEILVGKTIAYLAIGLTVGAALVAAAVFALGVPLQGAVVWVAATVALVLLASLALGMVLSMISGSETQAVQYAMLSLLAGMFFSGFILDVDQLATPYRYISNLLPVTYGINMLHDVMLRGVTPSSADLIGLGALVVVYGGLAIVLLRRRLRTE